LTGLDGVMRVPERNMSTDEEKRLQGQEITGKTRLAKYLQ